MLLAVLLTTTAPHRANAAESGSDDRLQADLYAYIWEPQWAFANWDVEITGNFILDDWSGALPEGIVRTTALVPGAKPYDYRIGDGSTDFVGHFIAPKRVGTSYYKVEYLGDANFKPITKTFAYTVLAGPYTNTSLKVSPNRSVPSGHSITLTADVSAKNGSIAGHTDGTITFFDGGLEIGAVWFDNTELPQAVLYYVVTTPGTHEFTATFEPRNALPYRGSTSKTVNIMVKA